MRGAITGGRAALARGWRGAARLFAAYTVEEPLAASFRVKQLQAVLRLTPLTMLANVLNACLIAYTFWPVAHHWVLLAWVGLILTFASIGVRAWYRWQQGLAPATASQRAMRRAVRHAAMLAMLWAAVPVYLFPDADGPRQLLIAVIAAGMMCAGGFALATVPQAGVTYVAILGLACGYALAVSSEPLFINVGILLAIYSVIVASSVIATARLFGARLVAEAEGERKSQLIGLLLHDFEEHASDWLWEIDGAGRLRHVSARLVEVFRRPLAELLDAPLLELIAATLGRMPDEEREALGSLREHLARPEPFRDLVVPVMVARDLRWWSLTAKPLLDAHGQLTGWRGVGTDITAARRAQHEVVRLAHFDALTGLANRHQFRAQLNGLLGATGGAVSPCAVLYMDLDNFKTVNDSLGHAVGDGLLRVLGRRMLARTRRNDVVARLGGDEFALIHSGDVGPEETAALARRLIETLSEPCEVDGVRIRVGVSVGIALVPQDGTDPEQVIKHADLALYAAKAEGRGTYRFFEREMDARARRRQLIEHELRNALAHDELELHFQPQIALASGRVSGFEALLRWQHPVHGAIPPADFIPVAEDTGLINTIGEWVLRRACEEAWHWPGNLGVAVNLSPVQFMNHGLVETVADALATTGFPPQRLELEITESVFLRDTSVTLATLHALRDRGIRVALDDFGTGYSSLAYLRSFPFDTLKIDRSFVRELAEAGEARAIVRAIIALAGALQMSTTAEGVESTQQLAALRAEGCTGIQGFLVARPMPAARVAGFLDTFAPTALPAG